MKWLDELTECADSISIGENRLNLRIPDPEGMMDLRVRGEVWRKAEETAKGKDEDSDEAAAAWDAADDFYGGCVSACVPAEQKRTPAYWRRFMIALRKKGMEDECDTLLDKCLRLCGYEATAEARAKARKEETKLKDKIDEKVDELEVP